MAMVGGGGGGGSSGGGGSGGWKWWRRRRLEAAAAATETVAGGGGDGGWVADEIRISAHDILIRISAITPACARAACECVSVRACVRACVGGWADRRVARMWARNVARARAQGGLPAQRSCATGDSWQPESWRSRLPPSRRSWLTCARAGARTGSDDVRGAHLTHRDPVGRLSGAAAHRQTYLPVSGFLGRVLNLHRLTTSAAAGWAIGFRPSRISLQHGVSAFAHL